MNTGPEIDSDMIITTMSEQQIVQLILDIDSGIGDLNFTQYLLTKLIDTLGWDMSKDEIKSFLEKITTEQDD